MINRALPEMFNSSLVAGNCTPADLTVLDRQRDRIKWQHDQLHHQPGYFGGSEHNGVFSQLLPVQEQSFQALMDSGMMGQAVKPDPSSENGWVQFDMPDGMNMNNNGSSNNNISRTFSCPPKMAAGTKNGNAAVTPKLSLPAGKESFKKRKSDKVQNNKAVAEDDSSDKRMKGCAEEGDSKITEQHSTKNNDGESSADTSKENSKASEVAKPDYIHVRARRGQATDSHSLAERVRREKISERMKYLQDLVPGCNKITGKAGMLDEIINYVQSLQRQVEFLSMKLAAVNPRLDFNIDDLFAKEMFPANMANFQTIGMSSEMTNAAYIQFNHVQQLLQCSGMESTGATSPDSALIRRTTSAPVPNPEAFLDASCFTQFQPPPTTWDAELQNLFNVEFQQGRTPFSSQPLFTGSIEAGNLKMEM